MISSLASLPTFSWISFKSGSSFLPRLPDAVVAFFGPLLPFCRLALLFVSVLSTGPDTAGAVIVAQLDLLPILDDDADSLSDHPLAVSHCQLPMCHTHNTNQSVENVELLIHIQALTDS